MKKFSKGQIAIGVIITLLCVNALFQLFKPVPEKTGYTEAELQMFLKHERQEAENEFLKSDINQRLKNIEDYENSISKDSFDIWTSDHVERDSLRAKRFNDYIKRNHLH
jgi:hypothetical protein